MNYVKRSPISRVLGNDSLTGPNPSFAGMVQLCTDRTEKYLKGHAAVSFTAHVVINFKLAILQFRIDHGYSFAWLLPVCTTNAVRKEPDQLFEELRST